MPTKAIISTFIASALLTPLALNAQSEVKANAELGYIATSGNTQGETLVFKFDIENNWVSWRNKLKAEALKTTASGVTSAEKYNTEDQLDYKFDDSNYLFGNAEYEKARFSGFVYTAKLSAGYGHQFKDGETQLLNLEIGPSQHIYKKDKSGAQDHKTAFARINANYIYNFSKSAHFEQRVEYEVSEYDHQAKSVTSVKTQLHGSLALKVSHTIKYKEIVPVGTKETDTETTVTLVYSFK